MRTVRVLQLASFEGNIGDNANMNGTRRLLRENLDYTLEFTNLEIRDFYYKQRFFDEDFVEYVNSFDLCIIGGGNYFELWVDHSRTGTSIDLPVELFEHITTPVVFYALGVDPGQGASEDNLTKFRTFLDYAISRDDVLISVRNDGAMKNLREVVGETYAEHVYHVPDGGLFTQSEDNIHPEIPQGKYVIGMNIANDMSETRFPGGDDHLTEQEFIEQLAEMFNEIFDSEPDTHLVLIPHIFRDIDCMNKFILALKDPYRRRRITVAPYLHGEGSQEYLFDTYKKCDVMLAMRFHANICSIATRTPAVGLVNYVQIQNLYEEIGRTDLRVIVNQPGFVDELKTTLTFVRENPEEVISVYDQVCVDARAETDLFHAEIAKILEKNLS